jgi:hypothetical protein
MTTTTIVIITCNRCGREKRENERWEQRFIPLKIILPPDSINGGILDMEHVCYNCRSDFWDYIHKWIGDKQPKQDDEVKDVA